MSKIKLKNISKKKVFIIGSEGFLGSLLKNKIKNNKSFFLLNNNIKKRVDFSNLKYSNKILKKTNPDIIINCAAKTNIEFCEKNKRKALDSNSIIVKNLSNFCQKHNKKLIQISTDHVYNKKNKLNVERNHSITNYYSYSKLRGEFFAKKCNALILRVNFFGYNKKNKNSLINWILNTNKNKTAISLFKDIYFSPLHITTLTSIIIKILDTKKTGIFNLGSANKISKSNFILSIAKKIKLKLNYKLEKYSDLKKTTTRRPLNMSMNIKKFEKNFNIKLPKIEDEIKKFVIK
jgi:dTDP-4-dehydrorhamnose reductase